ncbi:MAG TPA: DUF423 domain-containing protein [Luteimonas sp.]|nr:DUF423 domain-containing protein [Luteimonas sp.]
MPGRSTAQRVFGVSGAILAAASIALAAYASHGALAAARAPLLLAAAIAFGHGATLATIAPQGAGRLSPLVQALWLGGTLLFSGSLVARHLAGLPASLAPVGGLMLMAGWLLRAAVLSRR